MEPVRIFLSGDVMTGRGIDQILAVPGDPILYESWVKSAIRYVELAEKRHGPIPRAVDPDYVWGDAIEELEAADVAARIINLETAVTGRGEPWPAKGVHYRMHPRNVDVLEAAGIDCCILANNHTLDWSYDGFSQTIDSLHHAGIATAGAGSDAEQARRPAVIETGTGSRVIVVAVGLGSSGVPLSWSAAASRPGVWLLSALDRDAVDAIGEQLSRTARPGDIAVVSIHWGPNWGYAIPTEHKRFARALIDETDVQVVHGHSSHHPLGIEVYRDRLILYGCGDLINDYEGIEGHDMYRPGLGMLYLVTLDANRLRDLEMVPMRLRRFRLERVDAGEIKWLRHNLSRVSREFGTEVKDHGDGRLHAVW